MKRKTKNTKTSLSNAQPTTVTSSSKGTKYIRNGEGQSMVAPHPPKKK